MNGIRAQQNRDSIAHSRRSAIQKLPGRCPQDFTPRDRFSAFAQVRSVV